MSLGTENSTVLVLFKETYPYTKHTTRSSHLTMKLVFLIGVTSPMNLTPWVKKDRKKAKINYWKFIKNAWKPRLTTIMEDDMEKRKSPEEDGLKTPDPMPPSKLSPPLQRKRRLTGF